ncbi:MAG: hypothetical protein EBR82_29420 [Caulobacteraceae bacterium]|nr:hypothetical protein [Caulobacteraceae bacterium]
MPLLFTAQTGAALLIGNLIGLNIGFVMGAWWHAVRSEARDRPAPDATRAYRGPWPIRDHATLAETDRDAQS